MRERFYFTSVMQNKKFTLIHRRPHCIIRLAIYANTARCTLIMNTDANKTFSINRCYRFIYCRKLEAFRKRVDFTLIFIYDYEN